MLLNRQCSLCSSSNGRKVESVVGLQNWVLQHLLALAKGRWVAISGVRRLGSRGSKWRARKDGEGRRLQRLQAVGQRLQDEREERRRGGDVVPGK